MSCKGEKDACCCGHEASEAAAKETEQKEGSSELLHKRMDALGVSTNDVERFAGGMTVELEKSCAGCADKGECRHDLEADPSDPNWNSYCPNANALNAFKRLRGRFPA
ncbi:MAG: hypothetical protein ABL898_18305 [Hyphomicrobiaceae bacterium]